MLFQEEKLKSYFNELHWALNEYDRIVNMVIPVTAMVLRPHFNDMEYKLRPGMITLTWTSMNIDTYKATCTRPAQARAVVTNINDIIEHRIEKNLKIVSPHAARRPARRRVVRGRGLRAHAGAAHRHRVEPAPGQERRDRARRRGPGEDHRQLPFDTARGARLGGRDREAQEALQPLHVPGAAPLRQELDERAEEAHRESRVGSSSCSSSVHPFFEVDVQLAPPPSVSCSRRSTTSRSASTSRRRRSSCASRGSTTGVVIGDGLGPASATRRRRTGKAALILRAYHEGHRDRARRAAAHGLRAGHPQHGRRLPQDVSSSTTGCGRRTRRRPTRSSSATSLARRLRASSRRFVNVDTEIDAIHSIYNIGALSLNTRTLKGQLKSECSNWKVTFRTTCITRRATASRTCPSTCASRSASSTARSSTSTRCAS